MKTDNIIEVKHLDMFFPMKSGVFNRVVGYVKAVNDVSFHIKRGETFGVVGESGCGKSTTAKCILRLHTPTNGEVLYDGVDLAKLSNEEMRKMRRHMQMVFQEPYASLDPRMTVLDIIGEPLVVHGIAKRSSPEYKERVYELMRMVEFVMPMNSPVVSVRELALPERWLQAVS